MSVNKKDRCEPIHDREGVFFSLHMDRFLTGAALQDPFWTPS